jgi:hypothetical protein
MVELGRNEEEDVKESSKLVDEMSGSWVSFTVCNESDKSFVRFIDPFESIVSST